MSIQITSSAFTQGHPIPKKYTGEGDDVSPPLSWSGLPEGTKELALICDDPDAPTDEPWVHWVLYKLPADAKGLPEGVPRKSRLKEPAGTLQEKTRGPRPRRPATAVPCHRRVTACITTTSSSTRSMPRSTPRPGWIRKPSSKRSRAASWPRACCWALMSDVRHG